MSQFMRAIVRSVSRLDRYSEEGSEISVIILTMLGLNVFYFLWLISKSLIGA